MSLAAQVVEDHGLHGHFPVESGEPRHQGGGAAGHGLSVHHEHHRGGEDLRQVGGAPPFVQGSRPVEEPHHSLDDGDIGRGCAPGEELQEPPPGQEHGVQVSAGASRRGGMEPGVDVVRPGLEGLHRQPPGGEGGRYPHGDGGLARAAVSPGENDPRAAHFSIPFLAGTPREK